MNTIILKNHPIPFTPVTAITGNNRNIFVFQESLLVVYSSRTLSKTFECEIEISVKVCCVYNGVLYAGTSDGLYEIRNRGNKDQDTVAPIGDSKIQNKMVKKIRDGDIKNICVAGGKLFITEKKDDKYALSIIKDKKSEFLENDIIYESDKKIHIGWSGSGLVIVSKEIPWSGNVYEWEGDDITSFFVVFRKTKEAKERESGNREEITEKEKQKKEKEYGDSDQSEEEELEEGEAFFEEKDNNVVNISNNNSAGEYYGAATTVNGDFIVFNLGNGVILQKLNLRKSSVSAVKFKNDFFVTGNDSRIMRIKRRKDFSYYCDKQLDLHYSTTQLIVDNGRVISAGADSLLFSISCEKFSFKYFRDNTGLLKSTKNVLGVVENNTLNFYTLREGEPEKEIESFNEKGVKKVEEKIGNGEEKDGKKKQGNGVAESENAADKNVYREKMPLENEKNNEKEADHETNQKGTGEDGDDKDKSNDAPGLCFNKPHRRIDYLLQYKTTHRIISFDLTTNFIAYTTREKTALVQFYLRDKLFIQKAKEFEPVIYLKFVDEFLVLIGEKVTIFSLSEFEEREAFEFCDFFNVLCYNWEKIIRRYLGKNETKANLNNELGDGTNNELDNVNKKKIDEDIAEKVKLNNKGGKHDSSAESILESNFNMFLPSLASDSYIVKNQKGGASVYKEETFLTKFKMKHVHKILANGEDVLVVLKDSLVRLRNDAYCNSVVIGNYINDIIFFDDYLIVCGNEIDFGEECVKSEKEDAYKKK